nr:sodium/iodide cotransporter-like [Rhipicephalus microplus]
MVLLLEYAVFGLLVAVNLFVGLYFSLRRRAYSTGGGSMKDEVFLGSHVLGILPLAASSVVSLYSSAGLVAFPAHFYAYGWHTLFLSFASFLFLPLATNVVVPLLYGLRITSIFQYIRLRFNKAIALTASAIYIFLSQSCGAISILAASVMLVKVFNAPLLWCNIAIGLSGTIYTALGGLRGVVWTDCTQFIIIMVAPTAVFAKIMVDAFSPNSTIQPLSDMDVGMYIGNFMFDLTSDENVWSCLVGASGIGMYRLCLDQMVVQRIMASRTVKKAQRTVSFGALLLLLPYLTCTLLGIAITIWYRGCDPGLSGAIKSIDQIIPHYITTELVSIPGFVGLYLAGVVSAGTSTISSAINSQAAILYVDVISPAYKRADEHVLLITRCTACGLGGKGGDNDERAGKRIEEALLLSVVSAAPASDTQRPATEAITTATDSADYIYRRITLDPVSATKGAWGVTSPVKLLIYPTLMTENFSTTAIRRIGGTSFGHATTSYRGYHDSD